MTVRSDIVVNWILSPRIVTVLAPSTDVTIQDIYDTLRDLEDEPNAMIYPSIISAGGKEDLPGGAEVGITATLLNAKLVFEGRKQETTSGSITAGDASGITLTDGGATFISSGVEPGAWVVNITDQSVCSVISVLSETELLTDGLNGGTDNQWDVSDNYRLQNVVQCEIRGGNLVGVDDLEAPIDPVLPTVGVQVVRTASSSATQVTSSGDAAAIADAVWEEQTSTVIAGSFGELMNDMRDATILVSGLVVAGSTVAVVKTNLSAAADYYNGNIFEIIDGSDRTLRAIGRFEADGTIHPFEPLPFVPNVGADIVILTGRSVSPGRAR